MQSITASYIEKEDSDVQDGDSTQPFTPPWIDEHDLIIKSRSKCSVTWLDDLKEDQRLDSLDLHMDIDTSQAVFKLSCKIYLKLPKNNRQTVYLFICAADICAVTVDEDDKAMPLLRFSLAQNAHFIVPRQNPAAVKEASERLLSSMRALSLVKEFTIHLDGSTTTESTRARLWQIGSMFPNGPTNHFSSIDLQSLYNGKGGAIFTENTDTMNTSDGAGLPPSYETLASSRHKRKRSSSSGSQDKTTRSKRDDETGIASRLREMADCLNNINHCVSEILDRQREMEDRQRKMEEHFRSDMRTNFRQLENAVTTEIEGVLNQYGAAEVESQVERYTNDRAEELRIEMLERYNDWENKFDKEMEQRRQGAREDLREDIKKYADKGIRKALKEQLPNMHIQLSYSK
ncbi:hypothetical protein V8C34DRAFT_296747 [Trichoderma compactum]